MELNRQLNEEIAGVISSKVCIVNEQTEDDAWNAVLAEIGYFTQDDVDSQRRARQEEEYRIEQERKLQLVLDDIAITSRNMAAQAEIPIEAVDEELAQLLEEGRRMTRS